MLSSFLGLLSFALAVIGYYYIYKYSNDSMHPLAIMNFMWYFPAGIAFLQNYNWNPITVITIFLSGIPFVVVAVFSSKRHSFHEDQNSDFSVNDTFRIITRVVFICCFISTIITLRNNGWNISAYTLNTAYDRKNAISGYTQTNSIIVAYLMQYVPYCALNSFFEIVYSKKGKRKILFNAFVILFSIFTAWFVSYSRGTLLILLVGALWILNSKYRIKMKYIGSVGLGIVVLFYFLITIRLNSTSYIFKGNYSNAFFNATYNYLSASYTNFNEIVNHGSSYTFVTNTFQALFKVFGVELSSNTYNNYILMGRPSTFLNVFYEDGGIVLCLLYTTVECLFLAFVYNQSKSKIYYVLLISNFEKAIFIVFYSNYLFTYFTIIAQYIITFAICFISRHVVIKGIKKSKIRIIRSKNE